MAHDTGTPLGTSLALCWDIAATQQGCNQDPIWTPLGHYRDMTSTPPLGKIVSGCTGPAAAIPLMLEIKSPG